MRFQSIDSNCNTEQSLVLQKRCLVLKKATGTLELLGCTWSQLLQHIESHFPRRPRMSWENIGEWHLDHVRPIQSFDLSTEESQKACFGYNNLQPLWAADNLGEGAIQVTAPSKRWRLYIVCDWICLCTCMWWTVQTALCLGEQTPVTCCCVSLKPSLVCFQQRPPLIANVRTWPGWLLV